MEFRESIGADFDAWASGRGCRLQLDNVGQLRKKLGSEPRRDRIDERLAGMIGANGIDHDALAGMEGVGTFGRKRLGGVAARNSLGFGSCDFKGWKIFDGAGPSEPRIVEGRVVANDRG